MSDGTIHYLSDANVATIVIDRPAKRNALTAGMCETLRNAPSALRTTTSRRSLR